MKKVIVIKNEWYQEAMQALMYDNMMFADPLTYQQAEAIMRYAAWAMDRALQKIRYNPDDAESLTSLYEVGEDLMEQMMSVFCSTHGLNQAHEEVVVKIHECFSTISSYMVKHDQMYNGVKLIKHTPTHLAYTTDLRHVKALEYKDLA